MTAMLGVDLRIIWGTWPLPDTHFQFFLHDSRCFRCYVQATANEDEEMRCVYYVTLVALQFIHLSIGSISIHCRCVRALGFFLLCVHVCRLSSHHEQIRFVDQAVRNDIIEMIERRIRKHSTTGSDSSWWWGSVSLSLKSSVFSCPERVLLRTEPETKVKRKSFLLEIPLATNRARNRIRNALSSFTSGPFNVFFVSLFSCHSFAFPSGREVTRVLTNDYGHSQMKSDVPKGS